MKPPSSPVFEPVSFTPDSLAATRGCSAQHIRDIVNRGELPSFRADRLIRISREVVERVKQPES